MRFGRKSRFLWAVLACLLLSMLVSAQDSPLHGVVTSVAAQTPEASNATVNNTVSVLSDSISLGSTLRVEGAVTSADGPLPFLPVALHMGDITLARSQTNESGVYVFSVPVGMNYVPAALFGGATVYTVTEPKNPAVLAAQSAAVSLPVNVLPAFGIVAGLVGLVLGLYLFAPDRKGHFHSRQRFAALGHRLLGRNSGVRTVNIKPRLASARQRFSSGTRAALRFQEQTEATSQSATVPEPGQPLGVGGSESTEELPPQVPTEEQLRLDHGTLAAVEQTEAPSQPAPVPETELALETARDLFDQGKNQPAAGVLYTATVTCLAKVHGVTLAPSMTHREKYAALQGAAPDIRQPLRTLTVAYERTTYAGEALTKEQQDTAIEACKSVCKHIGRADSK